MTETSIDMSEIWSQADGALARPVPSWRNGEGLLLLAEAGGLGPPDPDEQPPDHEVTLEEINHESRNLPPERKAALEAERIRESKLTYDESLAESRARQAKKDALRPAWAEFYERNGLPEHAARMRAKPTGAA